MSADNAWFVAQDADCQWWVFGGFMSYIEDWDSPELVITEDEKRAYILRHVPPHQCFGQKDAAILYAHRLNSGEVDSYWNPNSDMLGMSTEYGVCVLGQLGFSVQVEDEADA